MFSYFTSSILQIFSTPPRSLRLPPSNGKWMASSNPDAAWLALKTMDAVGISTITIAGEQLDVYDDFLQRYSWAIPNGDALKALAEFIGNKTVLEIGSGRGLWAYLLQKYCGLTKPVICTDIYKTDIFDIDYPFVSVEILSAQAAIEKYNGFAEALLMIWPPAGDNMAVEALKAFAGKYVIYVGEDRGGANANAAFFDEMAKYRELKQLDIPRYRADGGMRGFHDFVLILERMD